MWMEFILPLIWIIGVTFSVDEMNMSFKVHHAEKNIMRYKAEGEVLHTEDIFQKEYTYQLFICNDPVSRIIWIKGCINLMLY